jgi:acetyl esterase/lipase
MPFGYWWTVAVISWGVLCALTRWRRFGSLSAIPALIVSELPFICRYGYYGGLAPAGDMPPMLLVHGQNDMRVPAPGVRAFAERVRAVSSHPVIYAELPGAYHDFDLYESIRSAAVSQAVEQFTDQSAVRPAAPAGS